MVVTITSSHTVIPSEATPTCCLWLSGSDQINDWTHVPAIYVYKRPHPHPHHCPLDALKNSLAKILVPFYPVAGRLRWIHRGRLELDCNSMGVTLLHAQSSKSIHDYHDFSPKHNIQELVPNPDYTKPIHHIPLLLLQLTTFSCGSLCVDIVRNTVRYGAEKIRESIQVLRDEYLRSELDLIEREENVESLRIRFQREGSLEATFVGNPNLSMAVNEADFGWGKAVYTGPAGSSTADAKFFIMPTPLGEQDHSLFLLARLQKPHMQHFINFLYHHLI